MRLTIELRVCSLRGVEGPKLFVPCQTHFGYWGARLSLPSMGEVQCCRHVWN